MPQKSVIRQKETLNKIFLYISRIERIEITFLKNYRIYSSQHRFWALLANNNNSLGLIKFYNQLKDNLTKLFNQVICFNSLLYNLLK